MSNYFFLFALLFCLTGPSKASDAEIEGVKVPTTITLNDHELVLNGGGVREKYFLDLYVGTLYLENKSSKANEIIADDQHMAIHIDVVSSLISSSTMLEAVDEGFKKTIGDKLGGYKNKIDQFKEAFTDEIVKGDHFEIAYVPGVGMKISKNNVSKTTIKGLNFKNYTFSIWLGDQPASEDLKEGMLGLDD